MPIPWDTLVPFGIMWGVAAVMGEVMVVTHRLFSHGKVHRSASLIDIVVAEEKD